MQTIFFSIIYCLHAIFMLLKPGGAKKLAAENLVLRQQLITLSRKHKRSPALKPSERILLGLALFFISPSRLKKLAIIIKPATLLKFHKALVNKKYRKLFSNHSTKKPGPKGPRQELIDLVVEMKRRNPQFGYLRITMQINQAFGFTLDKGVIKRILDKHYFPDYHNDGPSWLSIIGNAKDSLWSIDLFRCESILLKSHWVMVVLGRFTRKILGFAVCPRSPDGITICTMFNKIICKQCLPKYLSSDHDPLFTYLRWQANLRILEITEIKTVPFTPQSHPFIERVIGTIRREYLDRLFFWNANDLTVKLKLFQDYYNYHRCHSSVNARPPMIKNKKMISLNNYRWKSHANGLFDLPIAA